MGIVLHKDASEVSRPLGVCLLRTSAYVYLQGWNFPVVHRRWVSSSLGFTLEETEKNSLGTVRGSLKTIYDERHGDLLQELYINWAGLIGAGSSSQGQSNVL